MVQNFIFEVQPNVKEKAYVFLFATCGNTSGKVLHNTKDLLAIKRLEVSAMYKLRMVDTWTPHFNVNNTKKNDKKAKKQGHKQI